MKKYTFLAVSLILISQAAQAQWTTSHNGSPDDRTVLQFSAPSASVIWAVLADPYFSQPVSSFTRSTNGGDTWTVQSISNPGTLQLVSVSALDENLAWALVTNDNDTMGNVLRTSDGGQTWARQDSALFHNHPRWIHFWNADEGIAAGDPYENHFEIYTTANGGEDWEKVPKMEIPVSIDGEYTLTQSFHVTGDSVIFGGSTEGKIFLSPDKGKHWFFIPCPLSETKKVLFRDSLIGIIGRPGLIDLQWELFLTVDGGQQWTKIEHNGPVFSNDLCWVPGTAGVIVSAGTGFSVSSNLGITWKTMTLPETDPSPYYNTIHFHDVTHGWAGGVNPSAGAGGIAMYTGPAISVPKPDDVVSRLIVYPNPSKGVFTISSWQESNLPALLTVRDFTGRTVFTENYSSMTGSMKITLDLGQFSPGIYFLTLADQESIFQKQLIVR